MYLPVSKGREESKRVREKEEGGKTSEGKERVSECEKGKEEF